MNQYLNSRKFYPSRGLKKNRDKIFENLNSGYCEICEVTLERKKRDNGTLESLRAFMKRRTCGKYFDEKGYLQNTECLKKWMAIPENNGRYKGIMPKCKTCNKRISYVLPGERQHDRCSKCYKKYMYKTGEFIKRGQRLVNQGYTFQKGRIPPTTWKKGHESFNKGKTFEEAFGKRKAKKMKMKLSVEMKRKIQNGICGIKKPRMKKNCKVCNKEMWLSPYYFKIRKTCSLSCNGKLNNKKLILLTP